MMLAVILDGMAAPHDFTAQVRVASGFVTDAEKGGLSRVTIQHVQHLRGDDGIGAVVDCQGDFISGGGGGRQSRPVRSQPVAARPQSEQREQRVIGQHGTQRPAPLPGLRR